MQVRLLRYLGNETTIGYIVKDFLSEPQNRTETKDIPYRVWKLKVDCVIHYSSTLLLLNVKADRKAGQKQKINGEERIIKKETAEEKKKQKKERKEKKVELRRDVFYSVLVLY